MKTFNVRAMVEGAIFAAITVIMGIFYRMPVLEVITFFWPVPIILIGYRHGFKVSILSTLAAAAIISLVVNPMVGLTLLMVYALPGSVIGMMLNRGKSQYAAIFAGGLLLAASAVLEFALMLHVFSGKNLFDIVLNFGSEIEGYYNYIYDAVVKSVNAYGVMGIDPQAMSQGLETLKTILSMARIVMPVSFGLVGIFIAYANFKVVRSILSRMGYQLEDIKPFSVWRVKDSFVMPVFLITAVIIVINYLQIGWIRNISMNLLVAMSTFYAVLGASIVTYFIKKAGSAYDIPKALLGTINVVLVFILYPILPFIGMFDLTADIRRLNKNTIGGVK